MTAILSALIGRDAGVEAEIFRLLRALADEQSSDDWPAVEHIAVAALRRFLTRPPAGWQAS
ncbi:MULTISPECIES: hypothetical protein [Sphingomonas]|uniref:Uncharacterized protein n=1 Tax=Sphingomonas molluscorum TaxID=418184 RepID=A0ABU8Q4M4_9SPHN|nr:hypothetical protein [Sphingomonas sp. JUb134]MBM7406228.1 hypothetical protein [Sphingomonas sp. JUb134]